MIIGFTTGDRDDFPAVRTVRSTLSSSWMPLTSFRFTQLGPLDVTQMADESLLEWQMIVFLFFVHVYASRSCYFTRCHQGQFGDPDITFSTATYSCYLPEALNIGASFLLPVYLPGRRARHSRLAILLRTQAAAAGHVQYEKAILPERADCSILLSSALQCVPELPKLHFGSGTIP